MQNVQEKLKKNIKRRKARAKVKARRERFDNFPEQHPFWHFVLMTLPTRYGARRKQIITQTKNKKRDKKANSEARMPELKNAVINLNDKIAPALKGTIPLHAKGLWCLFNPLSSPQNLSSEYTPQRVEYNFVKDEQLTLSLADYDEQDERDTPLYLIKGHRIVTKITYPAGPNSFSQAPTTESVTEYYEHKLDEDKAIDYILEEAYAAVKEHHYEWPELNLSFKAVAGTTATIAFYSALFFALSQCSSEAKIETIDNTWDPETTSHSEHTSASIESQPS